MARERGREKMFRLPSAISFPGERFRPVHLAFVSAYCFLSRPLPSPPRPLPYRPIPSHTGPSRPIPSHTVEPSASYETRNRACEKYLSLEHPIQRYEFLAHIRWHNAALHDDLVQTGLLRARANAIRGRVVVVW